MIDEDVVHEYKMLEQAQRNYRYLLNRAPHCRDPEHPGCERCEETEEWDDEVI